MKTQMKRIARLIPITLLWLCPPSAHAQRVQDNYYWDQTWTKTGGTNSAANGGLYTPYGVAIGPDGKVYVGDEGYTRIQVYQPNGTYAFSITNGFGGGLNFSAPRGMVFGSDGNLYVADRGYNKVYVFTPEGVFVRAIGASSGAGQMSGVQDVGVSRSGEVFVLETGQYNARVSVFSVAGDFLRQWASYGSMSGQLWQPPSLAVSPNGRVFISSGEDLGDGSYSPWRGIKIFSADGIYLGRLSFGFSTYTTKGDYFYQYRFPCSLRFDNSGLLHVVAGGYWVPHATYNLLTYYILTPDNSVFYSADFAGGITATWPCAAVGGDGLGYVVLQGARQLYQIRSVFREQPVPPRNAIPQPLVFKTQQRTGTSIVDIDYQVTDMDDTNVHVAAVVFKNAVGNFSNCIRNLTLIENTATNLGPGITANEPHRITWNAGADWSTSLGNYKVALLAKDSRTNLLDIHYLRIPAGNGMPDLTISRSPLIQSDYSQVWWWLLATGDAGIGLSTQRIVGVGSTYDNQVLCDNGSTTLSGRTYIHEKMNLREATAAEINWARQAAFPGNTNRWSRGGPYGRPTYVNEFGFDTTDWGTNAFWVVPLN